MTKVSVDGLTRFALKKPFSESTRMENSNCEHRNFDSGKKLCTKIRSKFAFTVQKFQKKFTAYN